MATHDHLVGVTIFFTVLTTITVGLRIFSRTKLSGKGAFGLDDVFLLITYVSSHSHRHGLGSIYIWSNVLSQPSLLLVGRGGGTAPGKGGVGRIYIQHTNRSMDVLGIYVGFLLLATFAFQTMHYG